MGIEALRAKANELAEEIKALQARADQDERDLTDDEEQHMSDMLDEAERINAEITRRTRIENVERDLQAPNGRRSAPEQVSNGAEPAPNPRQGPDVFVPRNLGTWRFRNIGDYAIAVVNHSRGRTDPRLTNAALSTVGSEGVGADGGFLIPPDFRGEIMDKVGADTSLLSLMRPLSTNSNHLILPVDESTPWGTTGIQAYWESETAAMNQRKPVFESRTLTLHKLTALVNASDDLLSDASGLSSYISRKAPEMIDFKISLGLLQGSGNGQPLGVINAASTVTQTKESSQQADTILGENVVNMYGRMRAAAMSRAFWVMHPSVVQKLPLMSIMTTTAGGTANTGYLVYTPPNGLASAPFGSLMGRPIYISEATETIGDLGDILLIDPDAYLSAVKGGLAQDTSMHLFFDQNATAFRFVMRIGGQPMFRSPIASRDGSFTTGGAVALEAR